MSPRSRAVITRQLLLDAAERLIAEHGVGAVSSRQVAEEAGQANNSAVAYHVGTKADLVLAVLRSHIGPMDVHRERLLDETAGSDDIRDRVACLVLPSTLHMAEIGIPSYFARFSAQIVIDPTLRELALLELSGTAAQRRATDRVLDLGSGLPASVVMMRSEMARHAIVHTCAERERALAENGATVSQSWEETGDALIDAVADLISAPTVRRRGSGRRR